MSFYVSDQELDDVRKYIMGLTLSTVPVPWTFSFVSGRMTSDQTVYSSPSGTLSPGILDTVAALIRAHPTKEWEWLEELFRRTWQTPSGTGTKVIRIDPLKLSGGPERLVSPTLSFEADRLNGTHLVQILALGRNVLEKADKIGAVERCLASLYVQFEGLLMQTVAHVNVSNDKKEIIKQEVKDPAGEISKDLNLNPPDWRDPPPKQPFPPIQPAPKPAAVLSKTVWFILTANFKRFLQDDQPTLVTEINRIGLSHALLTQTPGGDKLRFPGIPGHVIGRDFREDVVITLPRGIFNAEVEGVRLLAREGKPTLSRLSLEDWSKAWIKYYKDEMARSTKAEKDKAESAAMATARTYDELLEKSMGMVMVPVPDSEVTWRPYEELVGDGVDVSALWQGRGYPGKDGRTDASKEAWVDLGRSEADLVQKSVAGYATEVKENAVVTSTEQFKAALGLNAAANNPPEGFKVGDKVFFRGKSVLSSWGDRMIAAVIENSYTGLKKQQISYFHPNSGIRGKGTLEDNQLYRDFQQGDKVSFPGEYLNDTWGPTMLRGTTMDAHSPGVRGIVYMDPFGFTQSTSMSVDCLTAGWPAEPNPVKEEKKAPVVPPNPFHPGDKVCFPGEYVESSWGIAPIMARVLECHKVDRCRVQYDNPSTGTSQSTDMSLDCLTDGWPVPPAPKQAEDRAQDRKFKVGDQVMFVGSLIASRYTGLQLPGRITAVYLDARYGVDYAESSDLTVRAVVREIDLWSIAGYDSESFRTCAREATAKMASIDRERFQARDADIKAGRMHDHEDVKKEFLGRRKSKWFKIGESVSVDLGTGRPLVSRVARRIHNGLYRVIPPGTSGEIEVPVEAMEAVA